MVCNGSREPSSVRLDLGSSLSDLTKGPQNKLAVYSLLIFFIAEPALTQTELGSCHGHSKLDPRMFKP